MICTVEPSTPADRRGRARCSTSPASWPARSCAPKAAAVRGRAAGSRARCSAPSARRACSGLPYPEEHGGGGQPYEVYLQVVEELADALGHGRRARRQRAHAGLLPAGRVRHRRAAGALAARHARRRAARRLLPVRARVGLRRRRADHPGGPRRRRLRRQRHQGVDHPRRRGRLLRADVPHLRRRARSGISCLLRRRLPRPGSRRAEPEHKMGMQAARRPRRCASTAPGRRPTG